MDAAWVSPGDDRLDTDSVREVVGVGEVRSRRVLDGSKRATTKEGQKGGATYGLLERISGRFLEIGENYSPVCGCLFCPRFSEAEW